MSLQVTYPPNNAIVQSWLYTQWKDGSSQIFTNLTRVFGSYKILELLPYYYLDDSKLFIPQDSFTVIEVKFEKYFEPYFRIAIKVNNTITLFLDIHLYSQPKYFFNTGPKSSTMFTLSDKVDYLKEIVKKAIKAQNKHYSAPGHPYSVAISNQVSCLSGIFPNGVCAIVAEYARLFIPNLYE